LPPEERTQVERHKKQVLDAESAFRRADDVLMKRQKQEENGARVTQQTLQRIRGNLSRTIVERTTAATRFESGKQALAAPLASHGVSVDWDEPQVDRIKLDLISGR